MTMAEAGDRVLDSLAGRIMSLENNETRAFVDKMKNYNTKVKTKSDLAKFRNYLKESQQELRAPETISSEELDGYLAKFMLNIRKNDGSEYEPDTLSSFRSSIWRELREKGYKHNIMTDPSFSHSTAVLLAKRKQLKSQGMGNKPMKSNPFSKEEIEILYQRKALGTSKFLFDSYLFTSGVDDLGQASATGSSIDFHVRILAKKQNGTRNSQPFNLHITCLLTFVPGLD